MSCDLPRSGLQSLPLFCAPPPCLLHIQNKESFQDLCSSRFLQKIHPESRTIFPVAQVHGIGRQFPGLSIFLLLSLCRLLMFCKANVWSNGWLQGVLIGLCGGVIWTRKVRSAKKQNTVQKKIGRPVVNGVCVKKIGLNVHKNVTGLRIQKTG